jgi:hypothetical protein
MSWANDCLDLIGVCPNRLWSVTIGQETERDDLPIQLVDPNTGETLDLTQYPLISIGSSFSSSSQSGDEELNGVCITLKGWYTDATPYASRRAWIKDEADAKIGVVRLNTGGDFSLKAGIWLGMAVVWENGVQLRTFPFYYEVQPTLHAAMVSGSLSTWEVRMAMRDMCPDANFLLDSVEFSQEEIMWAIRRPIEYWNGALPPVSLFTVDTFPFRYQWLDATVGELLLMAALWMRRNDLDYSAAGLQIMDTKKWPDYHKLGTEKIENWKKYVEEKKKSLNAEGAYGTLTGYRGNPYR